MIQTDPFGAFNSGLANLGQSLQVQRQQERQAGLDAQSKMMHDLQVQAQQMELAKAKREQDYQTGLQTAMQNIQPQTTTSITPAAIAATSADQMPGFDALTKYDLGNIGYSPESDTAKYPDLASLQKAVSENPGFAKLSGSDKRLNTMKLEADTTNEMNSALSAPTSLTGLQPTVDANKFNLPQTPASPVVQAYNEGRVSTTTTKQSPMQVAADYAISQGRPADAEKFIALSDAQKQRQSGFDAYGGQDAKYKADALADKFKTFGSVAEHVSKIQGGDQILKQIAPQIFPGIDISKMTNDSGIITAEIPGLPGYTMVKMPGKPAELIKPDKDAKGFDTIDFGDKVKIVPRDGSAPYYEKKGMTPGAAARITINNGGGDDEDVQAWAKAVKEGRANLQDVPNRGTVRSRVVKALEGQGGTDYAGSKADNAAYGASLTQQTKQLGAMGSFVKNIDKQVGRFETLSKELASFDTRLLNVPLRQVRGRVAGSPNQAKIDMYLAEISSETGKLASGATGSVAELSQGAREKWEKIHDPNLSMADLLSLLKETRHAGQMRMDSVKEQLDETRKGRSGGKTASKKLDASTAQNFLKAAGGDKDKARQMAQKAGYNF